MNEKKQWLRLSDIDGSKKVEPEANIEQKVEETKQEPQKVENKVESVEQPAKTKETSEPVGQETKTDVDGWINKLKEFTGGEIDNPDKLKEVLSNTKQYREELESLRAKQSESPYANDLTKKLDEMYRNGASNDQVQNFLKFQSLDIETLDALDARKMRLMYEQGYTQEQANDYIELNYKLDEDEYDEKEIQRSKKKLALDSLEDRKFLQGLKVELGKTDNTKKQENEAAIKQYQETVSNWLPNAVQGLSEVKLKLADGDDAPEFGFKFEDDFKAQIPKIAQDFILSNGLKPSEETKAAVANHINNVWTVLNRDTIAKTAWSEAYAAAEEKFRNKYKITDTRKEDVVVGADGDGFRAFSRRFVEGQKQKSPFKQ